MKKNIKEIENRLETLMKENAAMISKCETRIEELNAEIEKAGADMVTATEVVDTAAFKEAKKRKDDAELELGMLNRSLRKLKEDSLVKPEEYGQMREGLLAEQVKFTEEAVKKYTPMIKAMLADMKAAGELDDRIEEDLSTLHKKVARISGNRDQKLPVGMEKYRFADTQLDKYPIYWFLNNLRNAAEEIGIN